MPKEEPATERFQVDLKGVMEVLAKHLYSSRDVFVRELMQNGVDAITARRAIEPGHEGRVVFEPDERAGVLTVYDDGVGLTEEQIGSALSRVGGSTKRGLDIERERSSMIGQFGIGMLSCFMVADEIVVLTRAVGEKGPGFEWVGRPDGTFTVRRLSRSIEVGTRVVLRLSEDAAEYADRWRLRTIVERYGRMLPIGVVVLHKKYEDRVSVRTRPWEVDLTEDGGLRQAGELAFGWDGADGFAGAFPLRDEACGLRGVGFLRRSGGGDTRRLHRVYIKNMFVTEEAGSLMPDWGGFCRCVIDSDRMRPTASRESVYEDAVFEQTKAAVASSMLAYLHRLSVEDPDLLAAVLGEHELVFREAAIEDDRFFDSIIDLLEFETSEGWMTFGDFRREHETIRLVDTSEQFRLIAPLARMRGQVVFNGGYVHHGALLQKAAERVPGMGWQGVSAREMMGGLDRASPGDEALFAPIASGLRESGFEPSLRLARFEPEAMAGLYMEGLDEPLARSMEAAMGSADELWKGVLGDLRAGLREEELGTALCLNATNESVRALLRAGPGPLAEAILRMIYVQSLIEAQQPLSPAESRIFSESVGVVLRLGRGGGS